MLAGHSIAALFSFEGPDRYAAVGGLGTRETSFARALGEADIDTTLFFVGDPSLPPVEAFARNVTLRRWCQWISRYHPRDVYDGEFEKVHDYSGSVPRFVVESIIAPAAARGERVLVIAEEWQTVRSAIALDALLRAGNLRSAATILWNANNTYGFDRIDWAVLRRAATIVTVSKYMKFELAAHGVPALVVPNGIHAELLTGPARDQVAAFGEALRGRPALVKVGRFDPDKNWLQAIDAVAELRAAGLAPQLIVRGGKEPYGEVVFARARERGLRVAGVEADGEDAGSVAAAIASTEAEIVHLDAFLPETTLFALYAACDAVLANSGKEPFGLVGLEVMAAGGIAVCGATGEEYAEPFVNAIVCDTDDGRELAQYLRDAYDDPALRERMRRAGRATAARYVWQNVLETLAHKVEYASGRPDEAEEPTASAVPLRSAGSQARA